MPRPLLLAASALVLAAGGGVAWLATHAAAAPPAPAAPTPRAVQAARIVLTTAGTERAWTGTVRARREADVGFRAAGRIAVRRVEIGQAVRAGDVLAALDPADLALSQRSAEADLRAAEATARQAALDAERSRTLLAAGHVSRAYDDQRVATARSSQERVAAARAQLELARNRLGYAVLRAPADGVVTALLAEAGQVVAEGQAVLKLAQNGERELVVQVPEAALAGLDGAARATLWARPEAPLPAMLREVAPQADANLRTYTARFSLPGAPDWVAMGMTGTIHLAAETAPVANVPLSALHDRGRGPIVWKVVDGRAVAVPVTVVTLGEVTATIRGALAAGDAVIATGPQRIDPGEAVRVVDTRLAASLR